MSAVFPGHSKFCIKVSLEQDAKVTTSGIDSLSSPVEMFGSSGLKEYDVQWEITPERFEIANDYLGMFQIYYAILPNNTVLISNYIDKIIEHGVDTSFNDDAMAVFVRLGYFLGDDTPFTAIKALPANSKIVVDNNGVEVTGGYPIDESSKQDISYEEAKAKYGQLFQQGVDDFLAQHPEKDVVVPISGGQDSRHILLAVAAAGRTPKHTITCNRFRPNMDADIPVAKQLCEALGLEQTLLSQKFDGLVEQEVNNFQLNSYCADENNWALPLANFYQDLQAPTLFIDGIAGDTLTANAWNDKDKLALYKKGDLVTLSKRILRDEGHQIGCLSSEALTRWSKEKAEQKVQTELAKYVNTTSPLAHFYLWNRAIREISHIPRTWQGRFGIVATPFLFKPIFEFLLNLPPEFSLGKKFHGEVIAETYPEYAHIPYAQSGGFRKATFGERFDLIKDAWKFLNKSPEVSQWVEVGYIKPRLLKGVIDATYGTNLHSFLVLPLYLATLSNIQHAQGKQQ